MTHLGLSGPLSNSKMPSWPELIAKFGVPSVIALGLVWVTAIENPQKITSLGSDMRTQLDMHARENREQIRELTTLLTLICVNTAKTANDRERCIDRR